MSKPKARPASRRSKTRASARKGVPGADYTMHASGHVGDHAFAASVSRSDAVSALGSLDLRVEAVLPGGRVAEVRVETSQAGRTYLALRADAASLAAVARIDPKDTFMVAALQTGASAAGADVLADPRVIAGIVDALGDIKALCEEAIAEGHAHKSVELALGTGKAVPGLDLAFERVGAAPKTRPARKRSAKA